jgi:hypothetical protein
MPSPFQAMVDDVSDAVDATFAETFEVAPMTRPAPNARSVPDPARPTFEVAAIFDDRNYGWNQRASNDPKSMQPERPRTALSQTMVSLDIRQLAGTTIGHGDRLRRLGTGAVYEVAHAEKDGLGRLQLQVKLVGRESL